MSGPAGSDESAAPSTPAPGAGRAVAKAAAVIALITIAARVVGFGRNVVFANTVGQTCLGETYQTTNTIPNIVFEVVAGGALAGVVVPLVAGYLARERKDDADRVSSALLSWAVLALTPIAVLIAVLARPITAAMLGAGACDGAVDAGASMLRIFAPQIVLYGVGIVLTGILQAHRRFAGPALAPLLSSVVVIAAYLVFAMVAGRGADLGEVSESEQLILSVGTTLGVVALSLSLVVPLLGSGVRLRPTLRFPEESAKRARRMAGSGIVALLGQQAAIATALVLSNQQGVPTGAINVFTYAQTLFFLPWAIAAVPIATSVFPQLSAATARDDRADYARHLIGAHRAILALSAIAIAAIIAAAREIALVFVGRSPGVPSVDALTWGIIGFLIGLVGYSMFALHSRALFALHRSGANAVAAALGWGTVIIASVALAGVFDKDDRVFALSLANSIGVLLFGVLLVVFTAPVARRSAVGQVAGVLAATALGVGIGIAVFAVPLPGWLDAYTNGGIMNALVAGAIRAGVSAVLAAAVLWVVPGSGLRELLRRGRRSQDENDGSVRGRVE
ncbi:virulence factor MviN [Epidermidibacterium keratini]|uniref:Virulence factor MviN n=1 Tax=Epidermidibacterium keratini TaxID=1891644 RepID=A0A7L4YJ80_9ACTN|nr:lipid II flippase MurJ [Epidermidibacterium keratini]QHB98933.1 virulence factor MviN [Epidermidibacterium keratini]